MRRVVYKNTYLLVREYGTDIITSHGLLTLALHSSEKLKSGKELSKTNRTLSLCLTRECRKRVSSVERLIKGYGEGALNGPEINYCVKASSLGSKKTPLKCPPWGRPERNQNADGC